MLVITYKQLYNSLSSLIGLIVLIRRDSWTVDLHPNLLCPYCLHFEHLIRVPFWDIFFLFFDSSLVSFLLFFFGLLATLFAIGGNKVWNESLASHFYHPLASTNDRKALGKYPCSTGVKHSLLMVSLWIKFLWLYGDKESQIVAKLHKNKFFLLCPLYIFHSCHWPQIGDPPSYPWS